MKKKNKVIDIYMYENEYMGLSIYDNSENIHIYEHRLNALINNSLYDVFNKNNIVHHKNHCKFDNRVENLKLMTNNKHRNLHKNRFNPCIKIRKNKDNHCKNGYRWVAQPYIDGKQKKLSSANLDKCKQKVEDFIKSEQNKLNYTNYEVVL